MRNNSSSANARHRPPAQQAQVRDRAVDSSIMPHTPHGWSREDLEALSTFFTALAAAAARFDGKQNRLKGLAPLR